MVCMSQVPYKGSFEAGLPMKVLMEQLRDRVQVRIRFHISGLMQDTLDGIKSKKYRIDV